ncbi:hypothetical protein [Streptomyces odonnellii]|uniref:hypothetical protein n=1 Tax=Streptomyces odonnellii TaxID=1417980 RepID=UPI0006257F55|nr:hypothetical protein [Streptomyces odonnellii]
MTDTSLPPYSGEGPPCAKCGYIGASTEYRGVGECIHEVQYDEVIGVEPNERLHRACARCAFAWDEAVIGPATA